MSTWTMIRAAGVGAYVMLFLSVAWGLASTTAPFGKRVSKASAAALHQTMSTVALVLLGLHLAALAFDGFMPFGLAELAIPMASEYRPVAVALGIASMYVTVFVVVASLLRTRIGTARWRRTHLLAVPAFVLTAALFERFASRGEDDFQNRVLSAMRFGFGGHVEKK